MMLVTMALLRGTLWPTHISVSGTAWLAASGILGLAIGDTLLFQAFSRIGPRKSLLFMTLAPPITALCAWPMLGEPITLRMAAGILVTILGVALVLDQRASATPFGSTKTGYMYAAGAAICQALGNIGTKLGGEHDPLDMSLVRISFGTAVLIVYMAYKTDMRVELSPLRKPAILRSVIGATIIGTYLGIWLQVTSLRYAPAGIAATLSSTSPLFVLPFAAIFLGDKITGRSVIASLTAICGMLILFGGT
jgi:drug/metabolite transporter (DMT)-like permease